jgi:hydroxymethylpyrimidine/phosphomethylpyrimidine kinase
MGPRAVVVKGGHLKGPPIDLLFDGVDVIELPSERIRSKNTHGTGCTFSSAIAAGLARGMPIRDTVVAAKDYVTEAIRHAYQVGHGHGPLHHFWALWREE